MEDFAHTDPRFKFSPLFSVLHCRFASRSPHSDQSTLPATRGYLRSTFCHIARSWFPCNLDILIARVQAPSMSRSLSSSVQRPLCAAKKILKLCLSDEVNAICCRGLAVLTASHRSVCSSQGRKRCRGSLSVRTPGISSFWRDPPNGR